MEEHQVQNIALRTLKQRCEYLQKRLNAVEEENCKLKLGKAQDLNSKGHKDSNGLEQRIITLNEEKSQMAYQIQMLTAENLNLWSHLSAVLPRNNIPSIRFSVSVAPDNQLEKFHQFGNSSKDLCSNYDKKSLEEISLKFINGIIMDKNELEKQYCQMIDLHRKNFQEGKTSSFVNKQFDNRDAMRNLQNCVRKLNDFREALYEQRNALSSTISLIKTSKFFLRQRVSTNDKGVLDCEHKTHSKRSEVNINQQDSEISTLHGTGKILHEDDKLGHIGMCPLCGESIRGTFENLYRHVSEHLDDENDEFVDANSVFEVI